MCKKISSYDLTDVIKGNFLNMNLSDVTSQVVIKVIVIAT